MFKVSIPVISDEELKNRYEQIKPVVTVGNKLHYLRKFSFDELRQKSYIWNLDKDIREEVDENDLTVLKEKDFLCLHRYGHPMLFKPSIAEVLSQIQEEDIPFVRAFEIVESPETIHDFYQNRFTPIASHNGYHVSIVKLYGGKRG